MNKQIRIREDTISVPLTPEGVASFPYGLVEKVTLDGGKTVLQQKRTVIQIGERPKVGETCYHQTVAVIDGQPIELEYS